MIKINGYEVFAVLPNLSTRGIDGYVIAAQRPGTSECVTANVASLDAKTWFHGEYFNGSLAEVNQQNALVSLAKRANRLTKVVLLEGVK